MSCPYRYLSLQWASLRCHTKLHDHTDSCTRLPALGCQPCCHARCCAAAAVPLNLLGSDLRITNYGGGNSSAKIWQSDPLTGQQVQVLWVKGSGGDLGS